MRAWANGNLLQSPDQPVLSVIDHGFVVGDGVFETIKIDHGAPFALTRHLARLERSAQGLGLAAPDRGFIGEGIAAVLDGPQLEFGRLRLTVSSGPGPLGSMRGSGPLTTSVVVEPAERPTPTTRVVTVPWARNDQGAVTGLKTTSYAENAVIIEHARTRGASEAILPNTRGQACEGTGANVAFVLNGRVVTPPLSSGCLAGITRALVLEWAAGELEIAEIDTPMAALAEADEVMLFGTTRDVQAVSRVDDRELNAPGPLTSRLQEIWARRTAEHLDP